MAHPVEYHTGKFPPQTMDWQRLIPLIGPANAALARYDGLLSAIPNADVLLSPLTTQEAVLSSRIEGTQATMGEVLEYEAGGTPENLDPKKVDDIHEIINYRRAMREAVDQLQELPLCQRVIKQIHSTLLDNVRGHDKARGTYKPVPNYIGAMGCALEQARFVPIAPEHVAEGMSRWEKYLHGKAPDRLVQLAIAHAEFEALHPFLDGNGRLGRMLVPLFLFEQELLHAPTFYLSEYLEMNRQEYYDRLLAVSSKDDWTGWCQFFLEALRQQAAVNEAKARRILTLYEERKAWMVKTTHSQYAIAALDFLFKTPIFSASVFASEARIPRQTAKRILGLCRKEALLKELRPGSGRRATIFAFPELINITEGRPVL
jgi:Fic family protein